MLVQLRDGSSVVVRPVGSVERRLLREPFMRSRDRGWLPSNRLLDDGHRLYDGADEPDDETIGAVDPLTGQAVGIACFARDPAQPHVADAGVAVVHDWRGRGLGSILLGHLSRRARRAEIEAFRALIGDRAMSTAFERFGTLRVDSDDRSYAAVDVALSAAHDALRLVAASDRLAPAR